MPFLGTRAPVKPGVMVFMKPKPEAVLPAKGPLVTRVWAAVALVLVVGLPQ